MFDFVSKNNFYGKNSPIECYKLNLIAVYCIILLILSVFFNALLLLIFARYRELRISLNMFIIALTVLNLIGTITELSLVIPSNIKCRFVIFNL